MDRPRRRRPRKTSVECLEKRMVMSADPLSDLGQSIEHHFLEIEHHLQEEAELDQNPVGDGQLPAVVHHELGEPDFWLDPSLEDDLTETIDEIEQYLVDAHNLTGLTQVKADYGFRGIGQTVAVIDSGIAWNHYALGAGFGPSYRVVGGWDFTEENDANPYDDAPGGSHGTHVAGIVGADPNGASVHTGVASGVDLVALRVFNDAGDGYFSWVESALQWVHTNRNAFENPITAVNLSLGAAWNSTTVPSWAMLEEEFAHLKADGIFISVSAGNAFASYNAPGLGYPAASPHVVPVMSVNDNGTMSSFSQRHSNAIGAPGSGVWSTVPDYEGNNNGVGDDWGSKSGTSMAAPYVAGASVLIREAMEFVGYTNITQQTIYDHMRATAIDFWDAATSQNYKRLHLGNAINALMPADDFGSTTATAHNLGTIGGSASVSGSITRLNDIDYFTFTAGVTGTVSFTASTSHHLTPEWTYSGTGSTSGSNGETCTLEVVNGQTYTIGISTGDGLGHYGLTIDATDSGASFAFTDWGTISQNQVNDRSISSEAWFRVNTGQAGYLTAEAFFTGANGDVDLEWYDAAEQLVVAGTGSTNSERVELLASAGQTFYLKVTGTNSNVDFRLTNRVGHSGSTVTVNGTAAADVFTFTAGSSQRSVTLNGVTYQFNNASATNITFNGGGGNNSITMTGSSGDEAAYLGSTTSQLFGASYVVTALGVSSVVVDAGGGNDTVTLVDSAGDDVLTTWSDRVLMTGPGYSLDARNFDSSLAYGSAGYDRAHFNDSAGNDTYESWSDRATISGSGYVHDVREFDHTFALASTGNDVAIFHASAGDDIYSAWWDRQRLVGPGYHNESLFFDSSTVYAAGGGFDRGFFYDTTGDDAYEALWNRVTMSGAGYSNTGWGFDWTFAQTLGGHDQAALYDSAGDDTYIAWWDRQRMMGAGFHNEILFFDRTAAYASAGGYDRATFYDTGGNDVFAAWSDHAVMMGAGYFNDSFGFEYLWGHASGGYDQAFLHDSIGDDTYTAWHNRVVMAGPGFGSEAWNFERTAGIASDGHDHVTLYDSPWNDTLLFWSDHGVLLGPGFFNDTFNFDSVFAQSSGGFDTAHIHDSAGDDVFEAWSTRALMRGAGYSIDARDFDRCYAFASTGHDRAMLYDSPKSDNVTAHGNSAYMTGKKYFNEAFGFDHISAYSYSGGKDKAFIALIDYFFERLGNWR